MQRDTADGTEGSVRWFVGRDGAHLAYRDVGTGPAILLLHGFLADGRQWLDHGGARALAERGYRVIAPDLRGHGESACSHDPQDYPPDVLTEDALALVDHLGLRGYALGGYSLGARVAVRMLTGPARPTRAIIAGQGLEAITRVSTGGAIRRALTAVSQGRVMDPGSPEAAAAHWITELGADPDALLHVLDSLVATPVSALRTISTPTLVVVGQQDRDQTSADVLAKTLTNARFLDVPGDHWSALAQLANAPAVADFLADVPP